MVFVRNRYFEKCINVFTGGFDYSKEMDHLNSLQEKLESSKYIQDGSINSWFAAFHQYLTGTFLASIFSTYRDNHHHHCLAQLTVYQNYSFPFTLEYFLVSYTICTLQGPAQRQLLEVGGLGSEKSIKLESLSFIWIVCTATLSNEMNVLRVSPSSSSILENGVYMSVLVAEHDRFLTLGTLSFLYLAWCFSRQMSPTTYVWLTYLFINWSLVLTTVVPHSIA